MNKILFEPGSEYLYAYIEGESDSYEIALGHWQTIAGELFQRNLKRVLVHEHNVGELSYADTYRLATELRDIGFRNIKIAILDDNPAHRQMTEFGVLVGSNRGLNVQFFESCAEAEMWLLDKA